MESPQRELVSVLLECVFSAGLISKATYSGAMDLVHSSIDLPDFFRYPVRLTEEANEYEYTPDTSGDAGGEVHL